MVAARRGGADADTQGIMAEGMAGFVQKPYERDQLAEAIRSVLADQ